MKPLLAAPLILIACDAGDGGPVNLSSEITYRNDASFADVGGVWDEESFQDVSVRSQPEGHLVTATLANDTSASASELRLTAAIPEGWTYLPDTVLYNGEFLETSFGNRLITFDVTGFSIAANDQRDVSFEIVADEVSPPDGEAIEWTVASRDQANTTGDTELSSVAGGLVATVDGVTPLGGSSPYFRVSLRL